jgi:hypothetical protein
MRSTEFFCAFKVSTYAFLRKLGLTANGMDAAGQNAIEKNWCG